MCYNVMYAAKERKLQLTIDNEQLTIVVSLRDEFHLNVQKTKQF